ncbi:MAG: 2-oxoglutarate dehydrogenase complex dihydrolipoyllysine-residue succinyltransferase [Deltaproteobacteria bacterium]|jgi:2-oxoglutarate dehydrogenase E2 component (dihydrolipoamide succinyltransferase)|nr:2-oxoglutarate dehydrogenase complex dihydrolipoyllysine-residue succinyltransferase [Deltaproteobacteria bacterium]
MIVEIKVPSVGESVTEALLAQWFKSDGDTVNKDEPLFVIETDKVTLEVVSEAAGVLAIKVQEGETVAIGAVVGTIDAAASPKAAEPPPAEEAPEKIDTQPPPAAKPQEPKEPAPETPAPTVAEPPPPQPAVPPAEPLRDLEGLAPSVRRLVAEKNLNPSQITGTGPAGRITKGDVVLFLEGLQPPVPAAGAEPVQKAAQTAPQPSAETPAPGEEGITRKPMSPIRQRIASHLLNAKQNTAMLTTFNDIDMTQVMALRSQYKDRFKKKYDISLGMMSFFIKACVAGLKEFPEVNAYIDDKDIIYHHYYHIGVAIGSEKGLVVPVIRHADQLNFAELEQAIVDYVNKIRENRLELADLEGGTFTISNGGVFGSLLSTPILNMPQSGILGMHRIEKRPVVIEDQIVIRPMMYVALSYDHRIIDGREAVTFLKRIKECTENPERMMMEI